MRTSASSNWGELLAARASRRIAPDRLPSRTKPCERVMSSRDRWLQNAGLRLSVGEWAFMGERLRPVLALLATVSIAVIGCGSGTASPAATEVDATAVSMTAPALAATPWATVKPAFEPTGPTETVNVVRIVDGDTIVVSLAGKDVKVRYIGMDTPEDVKPESPVEPMSREAAAANTRLVGGQTVVMEKDISETDQYGRLLRYVWLHQGPTWTLVNLELVRLGYATALRYPPDVKYADLFDSAPRPARNRRCSGSGVSRRHRRRRPHPLRSRHPGRRLGRRRNRPRRPAATRRTTRVCRSSPTSTAPTCARWVWPRSK
jgi:micrococcal nuclease